MISKEYIIEAYLFLRKHNQSIPSETLDFMKDSALACLNEFTPIDELLKLNPINTLSTKFCYIGKCECGLSVKLQCEYDADGKLATNNVGD